MASGYDQCSGVVTGYGKWVVDLLDYLRHDDVSLLHLYMYFFAASSLIFLQFISKLIFYACNILH